jgi:hypothetical protein
MSQEIDPTPDAPGGVAPSPPPAAPAGRRPLGCWAIGAVTCGSLFLIFAVFSVVVGWLVWPHMGQFGNTIREMGECTQQLQAIGSALGRYRTAHGGRYPASLAALYPQFISRRDRLHCPADPSSPDQVSYQYTPPPASQSEDPAPDTVVVTCNRHRITLAGHTSIYLLQLRADGQVRQQTKLLAPDGVR